MAKAYKNRTHGELIEEIKELKAEVGRKNQAFKRIKQFAGKGNITACKQAASKQI